MSWNGTPVIDLDSPHRGAGRPLLRRLHRSRLPRRLSAALRGRGRGRQKRATGTRSSAAARRSSSPSRPGRPLGRRDTFGLTRRSSMEGGRKRLSARPRRRAAADPAGGELGRQGRASRTWTARQVDVNVLYPDARLELLRAARRGLRERALPRLPPLGRRLLRPGPARASSGRWSPTCATSQPGVAEIRHWAERDPNLVGIYISPQAPEGKLLDNPDLYPLYEVAQELDLPLLAHGGTARPPYGPGHVRPRRRVVPAPQLREPVGGHGRARRPRSAAGSSRCSRRCGSAIIETGGGWLPLALDRLDTHYIMSPGPRPQPQAPAARRRSPRAATSTPSTRWERSLEFCVQELGEDLWLFATDWPHGDTAWPESRRAGRRAAPELTERAKRKILGENALRLCPRLRG